MKFFITLLLSLIIGIGIGWKLNSNDAVHAARLKEQEAIWQNEKRALESALNEAQKQLANANKTSPAREVVQIVQKQSAKEIIDYLKTLQIGHHQTKNVRLAIQQFENLITQGRESLPDI